MSADNLIYVKHVKDVGFVVLDNLSASVDYSPDALNRMKPYSVHETLEAAVMAAHKLDREGYYEYGVQVDHVLARTPTQRGATMAKKPRKPEWERKSCGCVKTTLPSVGKVLIRCSRHRDKPYSGKRVLCYWDESGIVQRA